MDFESVEAAGIGCYLITTSLGRMQFSLNARETLSGFCNCICGSDNTWHALTRGSLFLEEAAYAL